MIATEFFVKGGSAVPRFFRSMDTPAAIDDRLMIDGQDAVHLRRSLRLQIGDEVLVCDGRSTEYRTRITAFFNSAVELTVEAVTPSTAEPSLKVTLYQGLPKSDKLEWIIQKCVELGVTEIVPLEMERSIAKIGDKADKKRTRWQTIANEAAGQSGRGILPVVRPPMTLTQALTAMQGQKTIVCYEGGGKPFCELATPSDTHINLVIGPEGGIAPSEIERLTANGAVTATLGPRILRCETAPIAAVAVLMALTDNLS